MKDRVITRLAAIPHPVTLEDVAKATLRVAAYARVSTDHEDQETSLAAQTDYYKTKITTHPGWDFVQIYVDDGISGLSTARREGFNRMIADCLDGRIDLVLTKSISRFARNTVDTVTTIRKLKEKGVGVYFEKENIFTSDSKGEFLLTLMSSLAQEESRSISENVRWGQRKRMSDGKSSLAYSRFMGYDKGPEKYTMVINEEQAAVVRRMFYLTLQGRSCGWIAKQFTDEGIPTSSGGNVWCAQTIRGMLSNEKYKGDALLQKEFTVDFLTKKQKKNEGELPQYYVKEDHEAIISPWLFDYVQKYLNDYNMEGKRRSYASSIFGGKVVCGNCGSRYTPRPWHSNDQYRRVVWQCRNRWRKPEPCKMHNISDAALHYIIHETAVLLAKERHVTRTIKKIFSTLLPAERMPQIDAWIRELSKRDVREMMSDEEDMALIVTSITILRRKTARFEFVDGSQIELPIPTIDRRKMNGGI